MKKLKLNKQVIAYLDNPNRIFGGEVGGRVTAGGDTCDGVGTCQNTCTGDTCTPTCQGVSCQGATCVAGATCVGDYTCAYYSVDAHTLPVFIDCKGGTVTG